jgi:hypothetical protein
MDGRMSPARASSDLRSSLPTSAGRPRKFSPHLGENLLAESQIRPVTQ